MRNILLSAPNLSPVVLHILCFSVLFTEIFPGTTHTPFAEGRFLLQSLRFFPFSLRFLPRKS